MRIKIPPRHSAGAGCHPSLGRRWIENAWNDGMKKHQITNHKYQINLRFQCPNYQTKIKLLARHLILYNNGPSRRNLRT